MIRHYFKIALRSLGRQKVLSFINISGLSIGLACFILFLLFAVNEFNYDRFHKNASNIYRVYRWSEGIKGQDAEGDPYMPSPLGAALKQDLPEIVNYTRLRDGWGHNFVKVDDKVLSIRLSSADPQFFTIFTFPFIYGNSKEALKNLQDIVITRSKAKELFGTDNVLGRIMEIKMVDDFVPLLKQELSARPDIMGIAYSEVGLGGGAGWSRSGFEYKGNHKEVYEYFVDHDYIPVMNMQMISGRNFDPKIAADTVTSVIINEETVKDFGWTNETAIGQPLTGYMESKTPVVIGVVKKFQLPAIERKNTTADLSPVF